jgi:hypothetical protein
MALAGVVGSLCLPGERLTGEGHDTKNHGENTRGKSTETLFSQYFISRIFHGNQDFPGDDFRASGIAKCLDLST